VPTFALDASSDAPANRESIMTDNILSAVLTFSLMAGGAAAVGTELFAGDRPAQVATLPAVTVTGHRALPTAAVILPTVTVTGCRHGATTVAVETSAVERHLQ
jgi:hypothetical protein